MGQSLYEAANL